jgi:hypothetical protein
MNQDELPFYINKDGYKSQWVRPKDAFNDCGFDRMKKVVRVFDVPISQAAEIHWASFLPNCRTEIPIEAWTTTGHSAGRSGPQDKDQGSLQLRQYSK